MTAGLKSVVVYGPQGCGKTRNAAALMRYFGLAYVLEDWVPGWRESDEDLRMLGQLVLTSAERYEIGQAGPAMLTRRAIPFDRAMQAMQDKIDPEQALLRWGGR